ncbi:hypothetical protein HDC90_004311 [Pedobacter sp. AK013]|nr:hypothetical protein [Pedobacter sp. AK013]
MRGTVKYVKDEVCAIELNNTFFSIWEDWLGFCEVGDLVSGKLESLGEMKIRNETRSVDLTGFLDDIYLSEEDAKDKLGL